MSHIHTVMSHRHTVMSHKNTESSVRNTEIQAPGLGRVCRAGWTGSPPRTSPGRRALQELISRD